MKHAAWLLSFVAFGCATTTGSFEWKPPASRDFRALASKHPHAVAVMLDRDERIGLTFDRSAPGSTMQRHDTIAILAQGGEHYAEVSIPVGNSTLTYLRARTIDPDGKIEEVNPEEVHTEVVRSGSGLNGVEASVKVFRVPGARVGSIVEYAYGLVNQYPTSYLYSSMSLAIPVEHYHFEVSATGQVDLAIRFYNAQPTVQKELHYEHHLLRIDQRDIPAAQREPFAPPPTVTEPWWVVTVTKMLSYGHLYGVFDTWSHAMSVVGKVLYDAKGKEYAGAAIKPSLTGCEGNVRCAVERALVLVNAKTELSRFVSSLTEVRPLNEVLASGSANNVEKAMLLRGALAAANVKASFVALARDLGNDFDPSFPSPTRADHLIVFVEKQPGLDEPMILDPSCEACELGQLPPWTTDRQAIVFGKPSSYGAHEQFESAIQTIHINGGGQETTAHREVIDAELDPEGNLSGRITDDWRGQQAVDARINTRTWLEDRWRKESEDDLHARFKTAELGAVRPMAWDKREAKASVVVAYRARGYAAPDGDRLIVPLSFLRLPTDRELENEPRRHDVMVREAAREEETMVFHLPSGWVASDLPHNAVWHSDAADGMLDVKSAPGTVTIRRVLQMHVGHWGPGAYDDLVGVFRKLTALRQLAFAVSRPR